jgi:hypothetical protein
MGDSGTAKMCPYCGGKGYISVAVELTPDDNPREELSRTTWVRKSCPLCDGKGRISDDDESLTDKPCRYFGRLPTFRQSL